MMDDAGGGGFDFPKNDGFIRRNEIVHAKETLLEKNNRSEHDLQKLYQLYQNICTAYIINR
jgi:hypothetical protein